MLRISADILTFIRALRAPLTTIARHDRDLAKQLRRAAASIHLNAAEGTGHTRGSRRLRFETALGSAKEVRACLEVADALGYIPPLPAEDADALDRIIATLYKLAR